MKRLAAIKRVLGASLLLTAIPAAQPQAASYYEFGKVVALGKHDVDVQTFDARVGRTVQRTFSLSRETRADVVHVGDTVEVIYTGGGSGAAAGWALSRLLVLHEGTPQPGPAPGESALTVSEGSSLPSASARNATTALAVPSKRSAALGRAAAPTSSGKNGTAAGAALGRTAPPATSAGARPVELGNSAVSKVPGVISVPLGVGSAAANPFAPKVKGIAHDNPEAECRQSVADWGAQPITLAVLDFRYPTEREESHDVGSTGGGSGTAVADLVFDRLGQYAQGPDAQFQLSRGDRQKLYRMDFAGAARLGRQLGVDAVLLGTLSPVVVPAEDPDFPPPPQAYTLRAGVVDTCTGQLLFRLSSVSCVSPTPGVEANPASCPGSAVTLRQAADPVANGSAFRAPIGSLLAPLEGIVSPPAGALGGMLGSVLSTGGGAVKVRLASGAALHAGDQVSVHASRLAKNPTTYTLHRFVDEEIGRLTLERVSGGTASGRFVGDVPPRPGDALERIEQ